MAFIFLYNSEATYNTTKLGSSIYFSLQKVLWAFCLSWISLACLDGHGGFINWFLSLPAFQVLSKIIYSTYLIHMTLLMIQFGSMRTLPYFTAYNAVRRTVLVFGVALLFAVFSVAVINVRHICLLCCWDLMDFSVSVSNLCDRTDGIWKKGNQSTWRKQHQRKGSDRMFDSYEKCDLNWLYIAIFVL